MKLARRCAAGDCRRSADNWFDTLPGDVLGDCVPDARRLRYDDRFERAQRERLDFSKIL
jgi:hypothetical protein